MLGKKTGVADGTWSMATLDNQSRSHIGWVLSMRRSRLHEKLREDCSQGERKERLGRGWPAKGQNKAASMTGQMCREMLRGS